MTRIAKYLLKGLEFVVKNLPTKNEPRPEGFPGGFKATKHLGKN